jgi:2-polyprenyl-6-methoxyphenol hydroxylase-like FAD-dependent oxidoreductase
VTVVRVLVIGGGIGGLCLAQGLIKSGLEVAVFERDAHAAVRGQGYRVSIKDVGAHALHDCLPTELFDLCVETSIRQATTMAFTDEQLIPKFRKDIPHLTPGLAGFGANRLTLREILLSGIDGCVHFGKTCTGYQRLGDRVRAVFADGTSAEGDLLVGADGTGSAIRRQLVPEAVIDEYDRAIYGRNPMTVRTPDWLPEILTDSFNRVTGPGAAMSVATCRATGTAPGLTPIGDYLSWMLTLSQDRLSGAADPARLLALARQAVAGWHPAVARIIDESDVDGTALVTMSTARPVVGWDEPRVTMLGDAIHTMPPGRGEGANTALRDAEMLRATLVAVVQGVPLETAKALYEQEMLRYGFEMVARSRDEPFAPRLRRAPAPTTRTAHSRPTRPNETDSDVAAATPPIVPGAARPAP